MEDLALEREALLSLAQSRGQQQGLSYFGELLPKEAARLLVLEPKAILVDVRSEAEWALVGFVPNSTLIEYKEYPGFMLNPHFEAAFLKHLPKDAYLLLLCRSGIRSHEVAVWAEKQGYPYCFNILEGFEGDKDAQGHRVINGWKNSGLNWQQ